MPLFQLCHLYVLDEIARLKGLSKKHIADVTFKNSCKLFGIKYEEEN